MIATTAPSVGAGPLLVPKRGRAVDDLRARAGHPAARVGRGSSSGHHVLRERSHAVSVIDVGEDSDVSFNEWVVGTDECRCVDVLRVDVDSDLCVMTRF